MTQHEESSLQLKRVLLHTIEMVTTTWLLPVVQVTKMKTTAKSKMESKMKRMHQDGQREERL